MPAWRRRLKQAATDWLSLPPDAMDNISRVTVLDGREVIVENIHGLLRVESSYIEIDLGHLALQITGSRFEVSLASPMEVHLTGQVDGLAYQRREGRPS